ncbi:MAG: SCO family protein [Verrucomicrobiae bacterium]|nr:SCO family protein [Verrucomicrobiae bacterium]
MSARIREPHPWLLRGVLVLVVLVVTGLGIALAYNSWKSSTLKSPGHLPRYNSVSPFRMTERSGRQVTEKDLRGNIWLANFIFTECPGICKATSAQFEQLQKMLGRTRSVKLVSFSVDPETDTPEVLARYADSLKAEPDRWLFLTSGNEREIIDFSQKVMQLPLSRNPEERVPLDGKMLHSSKFVLVDSRGVIRGQYDGLGPEALPKILQDIGFLMREEGLK